MPSPFPGMDPYLEAFWRDVHSRLIVYSGDALQERLPRDLLARVEEGVSVDYGDEGPGRSVTPDVRVAEEPPFFGGGGFGGGGGLATAAETVVVAEPLVVPVEPPPTRHVEILDAARGNRVVTVIEFLSPTNKLAGYGRESYRRKQRDYVAAGVNLVEIDLIRQGEFTLAVPPESLPRTHRAPYLACVRRADRPGDALLYRLPLRDRLPAVPIPLRPSDRDVPLELAPLLAACYDRGRYDRIDYAGPPVPPFGPDDSAWADALLRAAGRRL